MKLNIKSEAAAGVVAGAAFIASAGHIVTTVNETNPIVFSLVYPIGIDGLLYVGIRSIQSGRKFAGILALLVGAFFSLAFNADAEQALTMPRLMVAASMPVCMLVAFVIEATGRKADVIEEIATPTETEWDRMNERVETRLRAEHALTMEAMRAEFAAKLEAIEAPRPARVRVAATVEQDAPKAIESTSSATGGRVASWDVEKVVRLIEDGRTDADVLATVEDAKPKPLQRTRRAVRLLAEDATRTDVEVGTICGVSAAHIARVRAAMKG